MQYIEKYADVKFKLPELPHLPPELHHAYYIVKSIRINDNNFYSKRDVLKMKEWKS